MAPFIAADLVHPHVYDDDVRHGQAEKGDLLLKDLLLQWALGRVETLCVDDV